MIASVLTKAEATERLQLLGLNLAKYFCDGAAFFELPVYQEAKYKPLILIIFDDDEKKIAFVAKKNKVPNTLILQDESIKIFFTVGGLQPELQAKLTEHGIIMESDNLLEFSVHDLPICPGCQRVFNKANSRWEVYSKECLQDFYRDKTVNVIDTYCDECKIQPMLQVI